ncbi:MAG: response regulator [Nitrospiraceae bacterium]|nr:response regulator [Nitrospiraceae bacterium]
MEKGRVIVIDDSPTVRKLAELVLTEEGYKVYSAENGEDGIKLAEEVLPSVILVDFIMPRMNGYQFCKMARCNPFLKDVPIILITAKGEDVGEKFTEKFGVVDYFIKPFQPEQLVEKVNSLVNAQQKAEAEAQKSAQDIAAEQPEEGETEKRFSVNISEDIDRILRRYFYKEFPSMLQKSISDILKQTGVIKTTDITISGNLAEFSLFDILQLVDTTKSTGKLSVFSSALSSEIFFDKGSIFYASTSKQGVSFLSGDVLEKRINISKEDFNKAYKLSKDTGIPILRAFVKEGMVTEDQIMSILSEKTYDAIYSAMELESGNFFFEKMPIPEHFSDIKIRIKASQLILEGARRVDERKFAAKMFQDNSIVFIRLMTDVGMEDLNLDKDELKVFSLVDGKRTINDIIRASSIDEHEAKRIFYTLTKVGILKKK